MHGHSVLDNGSVKGIRPPPTLLLPATRGLFRNTFMVAMAKDELVGVYCSHVGALLMTPCSGTSDTTNLLK